MSDKIIINEVGLYEILISLKSEWKKIASFTILCLMTSLVYLKVRVPVYEINFIIGKPTENDILELNKGRVYQKTPRNIMSDLKNILKNNIYIFDFCGKENSICGNKFQNDNLTKENIGKISESIRVSYIIEENQNIEALEVFFKYKSNIKGEYILNSYIEYSINKLKEKYINGFRNKKEYLRQDLERRFRSNKAAYVAYKESSLGKINEAIKIAEKINLEKIHEKINYQETKTNNTILKTEIINQEKPLYYRGFQALKAEKEAITGRNNEIYFIDGVVEYSKEINYLNNLNIENNKFNIVGWIKKPYGKKTGKHKFFKRYS